MSKKICLFFMIFVIACVAMALTACTPTHEHVFDQQNVGEEFLKTPATCSSQGEYYISCKCGEISDKKATFVAGEFGEHDIITHQGKQPTCQEDGYLDYETCKNCDYTTYQVVASSGHQYTITTIEPTCTERGYTEYRCSCDFFYESDYVPALDHDEVIDQAVPKTCTTDGLTQGSHCSRCPKIFVAQQVIPKGHEEVIDEAVPKTCKTDGLTEGSHCGKCDEILVKQQKVPMGHDKVLDKAVEATCTADGLTEGSHCGECDEVFLAQKPVPKKGHDLKQGLCSRCDYEYYTEGITFDKNLATDTYSVASINVSDVHDVVIPSRYNGKLVTDVLGYVVRSGEVTSITLPKSIKSIQHYAFYNCISLTNIYYNGTVEDWCNVSVWGDTSFGNVQNFYVLDDNGSVKANERKYSLLTKLVIPSSVTTIKAYQFYSFNCITSVKMEEGVQEVMDYAFFACTNLQSVTLAKSTQSIGTNAFAYCSNLSTIYIFGNLTKIGGNAFSNCTKLQTVYYEKTQQEWQRIDIAYGNDYLTRAQINYGFANHY